MQRIHIKNCGMQNAASVNTAVETGANYLGVIHYPASKRYISPQHASGLAIYKQQAKMVAVTVNADDALLGEILSFGYADYLQLHGDESPQRVLEIKEKIGMPTIKAVGIADAGDVLAAARYQEVADMLLLDTKHADYGGTGASFDWTLLQGLKLRVPWFLSGGLNAENVTSAIEISGATMVDVASGIEREPGVKDEAKIRKFNKTVLAYAH